MGTFAHGSSPRLGMLVVYLDPYFLGDPLFVPGLARDLAARGTGLVLIHGSGERGERALESLGRMPTTSDGLWQVEDEQGRTAVERATRELNREIAHEINEAGVASIRATGADRGLLKLADGSLKAGAVGWLRDLTRQGVVIVLAGLVQSPDGIVEADAASAAGVLADALGAPLAVLATRSLDESASWKDQADAFPDPSAVARAAASPVPVAAGLRTQLRRSEWPSASLSTT